MKDAFYPHKSDKNAQQISEQLSKDGVVFDQEKLKDWVNSSVK